jgi:Matrixin
MRRAARKKAKAAISSANPVDPLLPAPSASNAFRRRDPDAMVQAEEPYVHVYGNHVICETDTRGYPTPGNRSLTEIVLDASAGFIPLWAKDTTLRWRFHEPSMKFFQDPEAAKRALATLLGEAILVWGDSAPVKFARSDSKWDFEIKMKDKEDCDIRGCVLASAFFPDAGRHELAIYPTLLNQNRADQINTLAHEVGHIFGLRHFFAKISETGSPAEVFGVHRPVSIMNYGPESELTADDRSDLKRLYQLTWNGQLTAINRTPVKLVRPFTVTNGLA